MHAYIHTYIHKHSGLAVLLIVIALANVNISTNIVKCSIFSIKNKDENWLSSLSSQNTGARFAVLETGFSMVSWWSADVGHCIEHDMSV